MDAYCFKCRSKREISGAKQVTLKNGKTGYPGDVPHLRDQGVSYR